MPTPKLDATIQGLSLVSPDEDERRRALIDSEAAARESRRVAELINASRVPRDLAARTQAFPLNDLRFIPAAIRARYGAAVEKIRQCTARPGALFAISGPPGVGKTFISAAIIVERAHRGETSLFTTCAAFLDELDACRLAGARHGPADVKRPYKDVGLLVLDELSRRRDTKYADEEIGLLINHRYENGRATILLTNETQDAIKESLGEWVMDRLNERGEIIRCGWGSLRGRGLGSPMQSPEGDR